jgi:protein transport protein SEC31
MKIRSFDKTAQVAWSPTTSPLLALGTASGALDASFSTSTQLEIIDVFATSQKLITAPANAK